MNVRKQYLFIISVFLLCIATLFSSCIERNIDPFEENASNYSIYGAMNMSDSIHYIRINNVRTHVRAESKRNFDGIVTFQDLDSGQSLQLKDTTKDFSGYFTHNFILEESLEFSHSYQLTVEGTEGNHASSTVHTPGITSVSIIPNEGADCEQQIEFTFENIYYPEHVRMEVGFERNHKIQWSEIGLVAQLEHRREYNEMRVSMSPRNLMVEVFPPDPFPSAQNPRNILPAIQCNSDNLSSEIVHMRYTHYGPEWDIFSSGYFPVDPLEWQDVEGGLGFLGAFQRDSTTFTIQL